LIDFATIRARRDALETQIATGRQEYARIEALLRELDRQLCAMQGGLQELNVLLASLAAPLERERISPYATGLNPIHEAALRATPPEPPDE